MPIRRAAPVRRATAGRPGDPRPGAPLGPTVLVGPWLARAGDTTSGASGRRRARDTGAPRAGRDTGGGMAPSLTGAGGAAFLAGPGGVACRVGGGVVARLVGSGVIGRQIRLTMAGRAAGSAAARATDSQSPAAPGTARDTAADGGVVRRVAARASVSGAVACRATEDDRPTGGPSPPEPESSGAPDRVARPLGGWAVAGEPGPAAMLPPGAARRATIEAASWPPCGADTCRCGVEPEVRLTSWPVGRLRGGAVDRPEGGAVDRPEGGAVDRPDDWPADRPGCRPDDACGGRG